MFQVSFGSVFFCYFFFKFFIATFQKRSTQTTTSPNDQKKNKEENTESIFKKNRFVGATPSFSCLRSVFGHFILLILKNFYCHVPKTIDDDDADPTTKKKQSKRKHQINKIKKRNEIHRSHAPFRVSGQFWVVFLLIFLNLILWPRSKTIDREIHRGHAHFS